MNSAGKYHPIFMYLFEETNYLDNFPPKKVFLVSCEFQGSESTLQSTATRGGGNTRILARKSIPAQL